MLMTPLKKKKKKKKKKVWIFWTTILFMNTLPSSLVISMINHLLIKEFFLQVDTLTFDGPMYYSTIRSLSIHALNWYLSPLP